MLTAKKQLLSYTRQLTLIGAIIGLVVACPYVPLFGLIGLSVLFAVVFRFAFHIIYESIIYTSLDFYDFMCKLKSTQGLPCVWYPIVTRRLKRSRLICILLFLLLVFPVFLVWHLGHLPILPLFVLVICISYVIRLCHLQRLQAILILERAKIFELEQFPFDN